MILARSVLGKRRNSGATYLLKVGKRLGESYKAGLINPD
jgi:hypothetical protein